MLPEQTRTARLEARITPDALAVVRRAADLEGRSVSDFVVTAAREAARKVIASFALEERASPEEARALLELWSTTSVQPRKRVKGKSRPRRVAKGR